MRRAIVLLLLMAGVVAGEAHGATLRVVYDAPAGEPRDSGSQFAVDFRGAPGEVNRVTARYDTATRTFTLSDPGASEIALTTYPAQVCEVSGTSATCSHEQPVVNYSFDFRLGDGGDSASMATDANAYGNYDGGDGDDVLTHTGAGWTRLQGGSGADVLTGGDGRDGLYGGEGSDRLRGGPGADRFWCGAGADRAEIEVFDALLGPDFTDGACEDVRVQP